MAFEDFSYNNERTDGMREAIQSLNKASLAAATDISYSRLRKYASGILVELSEEERNKIYDYLVSLAQKFK